MRTFPSATWTLAANDTGRQDTVWMGLLSGDSELSADSYRRVPVDPLRIASPGGYEVEGVFEPGELWDGITGLAFWHEPEGGKAFFVKAYESPVSVEPGFKIKLKMRIRGEGSRWKTIIGQR